MFAFISRNTNLLSSAEEASLYFEKNISLGATFDKEKFSKLFEQSENNIIHRKFFDEYEKTIPSVKFIHLVPAYDYERIVGSFNTFNKIEGKCEKIPPKFKERCDAANKFNKTEVFKNVGNAFFYAFRRINILENNKIIGHIELTYDYSCPGDMVLSFINQNNDRSCHFRARDAKDVEKIMDEFFFEHFKN